MSEITIRPMTSMAAIREIEPVQRSIWNYGDLEILPCHTLHALAQNGAALLGAYDGAKLVGFSLAVLGTIESPERIDQVAAARLKMYSVVTGVLAAYQGRGVGFELKLAQREFALRIGVRLITWTYDPLESRNARFNVGKLGVICHRYLRHFHGDISGQNAGLPTDRFEAEWWVTSNRVEGRVVKKRGALSLEALLGAGALLVNEASFDDQGLPVPAGDASRGKATTKYGPGNSAILLLVEIPANFQEIRQKDSALALRWRQHSRQLFEELFLNSYMVSDFVHQQDPAQRRHSYYLLTHKDA
jgi:predicted GNAT superfamily acetyltransferase